MQLGRSGPDPRDATDLARALAAATAARGHRPAITVLGAGPDGDRRDEQAFASLHQWVAKGAHLLQVDLGLRPGDRLHLDAPPGWMAASVCLAAWWVGATITDDADGAEASIAHESRATTATDWVLGDAIDGTPVASGAGTPWAIDVQAFPDQPSMPGAAPDLPALASAGATVTQGELLARARALPSGRIGLRITPGAAPSLLRTATVLAARPAATGEPVVLVIPDEPGADRAGPVPPAIDAENVQRWLDD